MITRRAILVSAMVLGCGMLLYSLHGSLDSWKSDLPARTESPPASAPIDAQPSASPTKVAVPGDSSPLSAEIELANPGHSDDESAARVGISVPATTFDVESTSTVLVLGKVVDVNGWPIAGAVVTEGGGLTNTRTDHEGRYRLTIEVPRNTYPNLAFFRSGYETKRMAVTDVDFGDVNEIEFDVVLGQSTGTTTVNGWIGTLAGRNIEGELIRLSTKPLPLYYSAVSDHNGEFSFEGVEYGSHYRLAVEPLTSHKKYVLEDVAITPDMQPFRITLEPLILNTISGTIVGGDGNVIPELTMTAHSGIALHYDVNVTSDGGGHFELKDFPVGEVSFSTSAPADIKVSGIEVTRSSFQDIAVHVDIGSHPVSGWVANGNGIPVSGARIILDASYEIGEIESSSRRIAMTDGEGYFEFREVGSGTHHISVHARGYVPASADYEVGAPGDQLYFNLSSLTGQ